MSVVTWMCGMISEVSDLSSTTVSLASMKSRSASEKQLTCRATAPGHTHADTESVTLTGCDDLQATSGWSPDLGCCRCG